MLDMVLNFMRAQEVFVLAGMMLAGWLLSQILASRRYRRLRSGIQSLASLQTPAKVREAGRQEGAAGHASARENYRREESNSESAGRGRGGRDELSQGEMRRRQVRESLKEELKRDGRGTAGTGRTGYGRLDSRFDAETEGAGIAARDSEVSRAVKPSVAQTEQSRSGAGLTAGMQEPVSQAAESQMGGQQAAASQTAAAAITPQTAAVQQETLQTAADRQETEVDSQLLYLRQSLDRIAASRDQRMADEPKKHRRLTAAEEQIILDILREYLD